MGKDELHDRHSRFLCIGLLASPRPAAAQEIKPLYFGAPKGSVAWFRLYAAMKRRFVQK